MGTELVTRRLRQAIMNTVKANGIPVSGDFWLMLVFRSERELKSIARELCIDTSPSRKGVA